VKRGDAELCSREWPGEYDPKKHRIYPRPEGATSSPTTSSHQENQFVDRQAYPSPILPKAIPSVQPGQAAYAPVEYRAPSFGNPHGTAPRAPDDIENAASVLEFLAWGRSKLSDYDVKALDLLKEPHNSTRDNGGTPEWELSHGFGGTGAAQMSFLQLLLPSRKQIFQLVDYHSRSILWYHSSYHGPAFKRELHEVHQAAGGLQIRDMDLRWAALLFAIMAGSMTCASEQMTASWGFHKAERAKLTRQWYKASVTCLNLSEFMSRHHIYSVEAIATLTMSAHILGFSNDQAVLLGSALKIAQSLGLQRLGPELDDTASINGEPPVGHIRDKIISREVGRRLWSQLSIQDWFSIPFSEMYSIKALHVSTTEPRNYDDETMLPLPQSVPTDVSYGNYLFEVAILMPQVHDAIASSNTLYTKYEQVLAYDAKMRSLATEGMPKFFSIRENIEVGWPAFIPWARRSLTICFAHKIIMIHRPFLGKSFTNTAFAFTRRTCMAASKTILKEAKQAYDDEGPLLWIDQAFMVAAGITLSLDVFHRQEHEPEFDEHRKLVEHAIGMLAKFDGSMIATRGIRLLTSLLSEQARLSTKQALNNPRKRDRPEEEEVIDGKRQKFDVPKFVETFYGGGDSFTQALRTMPTGGGIDTNTAAAEPDKAPIATTKENLQTSDLVYETFAELFPPQTGMSNIFLFEDLLNFDVF
jgi:hypothetical protein